MITYPDVIEMILSLYDCESCEEFVELWNAFVTLNDHGLIDDECWSIFLRYAEDIDFDCELDRVVRIH